MNALADIAARAAQRSLPVLLAGGHAVIAYGYQSSTFVVDLIVRKEDRPRWLELMAQLGFVLFHGAQAFLQFNPGSGQGQPVDLILASGETFSQLEAAAVDNPRGTGFPRLIALKHLVAMKCHAIKYGHPGRILRDADDLIHLFAANRLDPDAPQWHDLILKYGTQELLEKLRAVRGH